MAIEPNSTALLEPESLTPKQKMHFAQIAYEESKDNIRSKSSFSSDEAIDLLMEYTTYWFEYSFHRADNMAAGAELDQQWRDRVGDEYIRNEMGRKAVFEAGIIAAKRGDLRPLKEHFVKRLKKEREMGNLNDFEKKFMNLISAVPNRTDKKIRTIYPAWMDPRFNPDASPLPPARE